MERVELTQELLNQYRRHPRILEVRLILLFDLFEREFGYNGVMDIFNGLCVGFKRSKELLDTVLARRFDIKRKSKTSKVKWRQEVMFMGLCYGETPYKIAKNYLLLTPSNFYRKSKDDTYNPKVFVTDEWLRDLDDEAKIASNKLYRDEIKGFLEIIDSLTNVLLKWKGEIDND
jgi:hypothetical protein